MNRIIEYKHIRRYYFLVYIVMILTPIIGFILYTETNWWMFFSCLLAYYFQLSIIFKLSGSLSESSYKKEIISVEYLEQAVKKEKWYKYGSITTCVLISILDLFPFFSMNMSFMNMMGGYITYEGGILVSIMCFFTIVMVLMFSTHIDYTDLFIINDNFIKTGMTPSEILIKEKIDKQNEEKQLKESEIKKYGEDHIVVSRKYKIYVNEKENTIFIEDEKYNFKDIISFIVQDNSRTINIGPTYTLKTNTGDMLGRAAIGGALFGNVGAVIGGVTASKTIQASNNNSYKIHNYSIIITVDSIYRPTITIIIGEDESLMNKIQSLLTVIINRNNSK